MKAVPLGLGRSGSRVDTARFFSLSFTLFFFIYLYLSIYLLEWSEECESFVKF